MLMALMSTPSLAIIATSVCFSFSKIMTIDYFLAVFSLSSKQKKKLNKRIDYFIASLLTAYRKNHKTPSVCLMCRSVSGTLCHSWQSSNKGIFQLYSLVALATLKDDFTLSYERERVLPSAAPASPS